MRKLIKKSLACCLVVVLTLTAMVGAFATSAEAVATVTAGSLEVEEGTLSVTVPVTIEVTDGFYAAHIQVASEFGALTDVSVPADADYNVTADGYTAVDYATGKMLVMSIYGDSLINDITTAVVNCTFTADAAPAAGTYAVTVTCPDVPAADWAESVVALRPVDGVITVAAHECTEVIDAAVAATCTETGLTEGKHCSECGKVIVAQEVVEALGHDWVDGEITYTDCTSAGNMAQSCSRCDATQNVAVDPKGHTEVACEEVAATCTTVGYTGGTCCSECGAIITERTEVPALGHADVYKNNGDNHTITCSNGCDKNVTEDHTYVDGSCVCGAVEVTGPVVDENLVFSAASVGFASESLQVNFRIANTVFDLYDDVQVEITPDKYDTSTLNLVAEPTTIVLTKDQLTAAGTKYMSYIYKDIFLYEIGLDINYMLKGYNADGELVAVSEVFTTSPAAYLKSAYASSSKATFRTLIADVLVVGAKSAIAMTANKPDSDLAKAPSVIEGFDISEATQSVDSYNTVDNHEALNSAFGNTSSATHMVRKSVAIGKAPYITYRIKDTNSALDLSKLSFKVSYTKSSLNGTTSAFSETYTVDNGDISLISGWINFKFNTISFTDSDKDITVEIIYDGETVANTVYSVETYLGPRSSDSASDQLAVALVKLGIAARAYAAE